MLMEKKSYDSWELMLTITAILSSVLNFSALLYFKIKNKLRSTGFIQLALICAANLIYASVQIFSVIVNFAQQYKNIENTRWLCDLEGASLIATTLSVYFMSQSICHVLYSEFLSQKESKDYKKFYYFFCILMPLIVCLVPILTDTYGTSSADSLQICYIDAISPGDPNPNAELESHNKLKIVSKIELLIFIVIPFFTTNTFNMYVCIKFRNLIEKLGLPEDQQDFLKYMLFFPIIILVCWFVHIIRIVMLISGQTLMLGYIWSCIDSALTNMAGILSASVFLYFMVKFSNKLKLTSEDRFFDQDDDEIQSVNDDQTLFDEDDLEHQTEMAIQAKGGFKMSSNNGSFQNKKKKNLNKRRGSINIQNNQGSIQRNSDIQQDSSSINQSRLGSEYEDTVYNMQDQIDIPQGRNRARTAQLGANKMVSKLAQKKEQMEQEQQQQNVQIQVGSKNSLNNSQNLDQQQQLKRGGVRKGTHDFKGNTSNDSQATRPKKNTIFLEFNGKQSNDGLQNRNRKNTAQLQFNGNISNDGLCQPLVTRPRKTTNYFN